MLKKNTEFKDVDFSFYKLLHKRIFSDLYSWAGEIRTINLSKKGSVFCNVKNIENAGILKFKYLKDNNYFCSLSKERFIEELTDFYNDMNYLHPFREGNGRTLRLFLALLTNNAGYNIDFQKCDGDLLTLATIKAFQGDASLLQNIFSEIID
ncbi:Fic family protein [Ruminococcus sp. HUN007]|uniref:Fic/DOC family protein n=1 Tax=Ruminococcus sp. HUN007 TaxID=1514668 RepID=UPI0006795E1A|nr:Fic family protein [Ruminococcus sp. HUN007]